jgi:hypothetical protein
MARPSPPRDGPPRAARHGAARRPGVPCGSATATTSHGAISRSEDRRTATTCRASYGRAATRVSTGFGSAAAAPSRGGRREHLKSRQRRTAGAHRQP